MALLVWRCALLLLCPWHLCTHENLVQGMRIGPARHSDRSSGKGRSAAHVIQEERTAPSLAQASSSNPKQPLEAKESVTSILDVTAHRLTALPHLGARVACLTFLIVSIITGVACMLFLHRRTSAQESTTEEEVKANTSEVEAPAQASGAATSGSGSDPPSPAIASKVLSFEEVAAFKSDESTGESDTDSDSDPMVAKRARPVMSRTMTMPAKLKVWTWEPVLSDTSSDTDCDEDLQDNLQQHAGTFCRVAETPASGKRITA